MGFEFLERPGITGADDAEFELKMNPAPIEPVPEETDRPFWSVMIPTYNPMAHYLEETLNSVLVQDPGSKEMQIELVDDCSNSFEPKDLIKNDGRIGYYRQKQSVGMGANWNTCIERARGRWIHILHQDDFVLPGFYSRLREGIEQEPGIGVAFCQHFSVDAASRKRFLLSRVKQQFPGILSDWPEYVFVGLSFQTPAVVVKRCVYESIGGFDTSFQYALDWDMWKRIAPHYRFWFEPTPLACYRQHLNSSSRAATRAGKNIAEIRRSIEKSRSYLPAAIAEETTKRAFRYYTQYAVHYAGELVFDEQDVRSAIFQLWEARRLSSGSFVLKEFVRMVKKRRRERRQN
jgi:glycosyltransferase involved in cell wall biosynthesis